MPLHRALREVALVAFLTPVKRRWLSFLSPHSCPFESSFLRWGLLFWRGILQEEQGVSLKSIGFRWSSGPKNTGYLSAFSKNDLPGIHTSNGKLADWVQVLSFAILPSSSTRQAWFNFNFGRKNFFLVPWLPIERCKLNQVPSSTRCIGGCTFWRL